MPKFKGVVGQIALITRFSNKNHFAKGFRRIATRLLFWIGTRF
jgi:hypothetical protein